MQLKLEEPKRNNAFSLEKRTLTLNKEQRSSSQCRIRLLDEVLEAVKVSQLHLLLMELH